MHSASSDEWFAEIDPGVADFRSDHFRLGPELRRLYAVREAGAVEAIIFYGARILEALAADALAALRIQASVNVFSNLVTLEQYSLLTTGALYSTHSLRRLGNAARHIQEELTADQAEISLALTEQVLEWFFLDLSVKPRFDRLCRNQRCLPLTTRPEIQNTLSAAENWGRTWPTGWAELRQQQGAALLSIAQAAAVVAEIWLDRDKVDAAGDLLQDALAQNPSDLRLQQLVLLVASRKGEFAAARQQIDCLIERNSEDDETVGIAAGAYKRMWKQDRSAIQWLAKSQKLYRAGWDKSKKQNAYLGINAATTALWLDKPDEAKLAAGEVERLLTGRAEQLQKCGCSHVRPDYWTQVSLAEALLLEGKLAAAAAAYRTAFEQYPNGVGSIQVTRNQMQSIAEAMSLPAEEIERLPSGSSASG